MPNSTPHPTSPTRPIALGLGVAILSPTLELATGHPLPYLLVLTALIGIVWGAARFRRSEIGLRLGGARTALPRLRHRHAGDGVRRHRGALPAGG